MRDIVIPYVKNQSGELNACIKLIEKNVPHRNIYVVEQFDRIGRYSSISHINQILKLKWAIENLDLSEEFYLFNDDFFVLERVDDIPHYHKGKLSDQIAKRPGSGSYKNALITTREWLFDDALSYELHVPFLFNKDVLRVCIGTLQHGIESGKCPLVRSWYANGSGIKGEFMEDVKNIKDFEGKTYLSTTESTFRRGIGDYIRSKI